MCRGVQPAHLTWLLEPGSAQAAREGGFTGLLEHVIGSLALGSSSEPVRKQACSCLRLLHAACASTAAQV